MKNTEIRKTLFQNRIPYWEIGQKIGVHENTILRWMRSELPEEKRALILKAIEEIMEERNEH